ncbi:NAD(P)-binding domain-containing protein [Lentzea sp. BCCO 10_0856]|uniref:NAD(P)-binding domain-containing protein n=1 Tax=Lentzea miocenica TaxID=3095431 RepID=A0ABU4TCW0_9PSEU|nr:NAD(P)-binding domain-containing protein [Lentzea sp. BCCO 10_0856]MDX8036028.1 NAD(P)-binding domain-containing protein [Lentzea sp. BCCO 10_0856]
MPTLGIIGSGNIGAAVARLAVAAGVPVVVSNSRGQESLAGLVAELGSLATAGTVGQAAQAGDLVVLSVPLTAHTAVPAAPLAGKIVLDTSNYYPFRDGRIAELDEDALTTSELVHRHFGTARLVKAFNNILAHHIPQLARPSGAADRTALPIAGDHAEANAGAATLIDRLGFDTVHAGPLAQSWRFEPEAAAYTRLYLADPSTPDERMLQAPGRPVPAAELRHALQSARRVSVVDRVF